MKRVLVIDDNPTTVDSVSGALERNGWATIKSYDPDEAAQHYKNVDIVLSDWQMPLGGGERVVRESPVPVLVHSGLGSLAGHRFTVTKGAPTDEIIEMLEWVLEESKIEAEEAVNGQ